MSFKTIIASSLALFTACSLIGCTKSQIEEEQVVQEPIQEVKTDLSFPSNSGALKVSGTNIINEHGEIVQLKGVSSHGLSWFPQFINQEFIQELHQDWNANVLRLAMYTGENGGYCTDGNKEELKKLVKNGVEYATNANMYVIIDWHILSDNNPNMNIDESKSFFEEMSSTFKNSDNVIYEICNEPNGNTSWNDIKEYANKIIPIIRNNDKDALIIVGTPEWSQRVDQAADSPLEYDNILYALHFYAGTHKADLRNRLEKALEKDLPIIVSEYGICDASGNGALDYKQADEWLKVLNKNNISYIAWNLANKNESSSMIKEECTKTHGFEMEDLNDSGKWIYNMLNNIPKEESKQEIKADGSLSISLDVVNTWQENGVDFHQYSLSIQNNGEDIESWEYDIEFTDSFEITDEWNGKFSIHGNVLHIENASFNGKIKSNQSESGIGFIVKGNQLEVKQG